MNTNQLPGNLPVPEDDGAADHLTGSSLPAVSLLATDGNTLNPGDLTGTTVIYIYPMTGRPDRDLPAGWNEIPGARGCTPQSCGFRDHFEELRLLNANVFGLSTQTSEYQREAKERLHLPFELLSDADLQLRNLLQLPCLTVADADGGNTQLYKRMTLIVKDNTISKVFYPVFPPGENAENVLQWLRSN